MLGTLNGVNMNLHKTTKIYNESSSMCGRYVHLAIIDQALLSLKRLKIINFEILNSDDVSLLIIKEGRRHEQNMAERCETNEIVMRHL